jgi:hypothetical protein
MDVIAAPLDCDNLTTWWEFRELLRRLVLGVAGEDSN